MMPSPSCATEVVLSQERPSFSVSWVHRRAGKGCARAESPGCRKSPRCRNSMNAVAFPMRWIVLQITRKAAALQPLYKGTIHNWWGRLHIWPRQLCIVPLYRGCKAQYIIGGGGSIFGHGSSSRIRPTIFRPNAAGNIFPSAGYAVRPDGACRGGIFVFHEKTQRMKSFLLIVLLSGPAVLARSQSVGDVVKQQAGEGVKTGAAVATEQTANNVSNRLLNKLFNKKSKNAKADSVKNAGAAVPVAAVPGAGNGAGAA